MQTAWLNHPQGCMGFRLETKDGVFVYATDNEPGDAEFDKNVRKLAAGADVLVYDAQYLPEEYEARKPRLGTQPLARSGQCGDGKRREGVGALSPRSRSQR